MKKLLVVLAEVLAGAGMVLLGMYLYVSRPALVIVDSDGHKYTYEDSDLEKIAADKEPLGPFQGPVWIHSPNAYILGVWLPDSYTAEVLRNGGSVEYGWEPDSNFPKGEAAELIGHPRSEGTYHIELRMRALLDGVYPDNPRYTFEIIVDPDPNAAKEDRRGGGKEVARVGDARKRDSDSSRFNFKNST